MRSARLSLVTLLSAGLAAAVMSLPAVAQDAAPDAAPVAAPVKKTKPAPKALQVQVLNQRDATLVEIAVIGRTKNAKTLVLASSIGPGGRKVSKIPANQGCVFSVTGTFDDDSTLDVPVVNLCKDPRITLVE